LDQNGNTSVGGSSITVLILVSESGESCVFQVIQTDSVPTSESEIIKMMMRKGYFYLEGEKMKNIWAYSLQISTRDLGRPM